MNKHKHMHVNLILENDILSITDNNIGVNWMKKIQFILFKIVKIMLFTELIKHNFKKNICPTSFLYFKTLIYSGLILLFRLRHIRDIRINPVFGSNSLDT